MDYNELMEVLSKLNKTVAMAQQQQRMSLDETLITLNKTLETVGGLLETIQIAILIIAVALSILLVGMTATCYYAKYKKYSQTRYEVEPKKKSFSTSGV
ncbi:unnamed protein product, partial [Mesorhabditis belari]|uniref:Uncharacterized protein n=1 Tax=Mesorhabditis belari TaxID=2138241 RepID=A0AAF3J418_9BILA